MSTMTATESRLADRRKAVPLLLSAFPAPPSHIPNSPLSTPLTTSPPVIPSVLSSSPNPPLSLPPPSPLPPVPGPSPISEHDALLFISAERSRRASKMSLASVYSKRDSTATLESVASTSAAPLSPTSSRLGSHASTRSLRSLASGASHSQSLSRRMLDKSPMLEPRICEEDAAEISQISLSDIPSLSSSVTSSPPRKGGFSDTEDDDVNELGIASSLSRRHSSRGHRAKPGMNDSISSIDMRDLPALQEDEMEPLSAPPMSTVLSKSVSHLRPNISIHPRPPTAVLNKDLPPLPVSAPPDAPSSRTSIASTYKTRTDSVSTATTSFTRDGAESPDIKTILASTPRPRRKSSSHLPGSSRSRSRPNSARRSRGSSSQPGSSRRFSDTTPIPVPPLRRPYDSELAYTRKERDDDDEESDYGELLDGTGTIMDARMLDREAEARLERDLEGFNTEEESIPMSDGEASDSSIDVQTPLPNLMLRDGMLSPNSKILPQSMRVPSPHDRHLSVASTAASVMTKSGIFKDQRDTVKRRVRHRDGTLLRGGIGLTTGLGWSDSEDEDAPSPLTRRISSLVLSRRTSASSLNSSTGQPSRTSSAAHPLSRSVSDTMSTNFARHKGQMRTREARPSLPPTAWSSTRTSTVSALSTQSHGSDVSSVHSASSYGAHTSQCTTTSLDHIREHEVESLKDEAGMATPSSASGSSVAMPLTPVGDDDGATWSYNSGKGLSARRIPSRSNLKTPSKSGMVPPRDSLPFPRERTISASSYGSAHASVGHVSSTSPSSTPRQASIPRPLRLPQASGLQPKSSQSSLRTPSARSISTNATSPSSQIERGRTPSGTKAGTHSPSTTTSSRVMRSSALSDPSGASPSTQPITPANRKPRIGAGMVYRTASGSASRPSMIRAPSSTNLRSAAASAKV